MLDAFRQGRPAELHYDSSKTRQAIRRDEALEGYPLLKNGLEREEYPYASTFEGGKGAVVGYIAPYEQRIQGGELSSLYSTMQQGEEFINLPVAEDEEPDHSPARPIMRVQDKENQDKDASGGKVGGGNVVEFNSQDARRAGMNTAAITAAYFLFRILRFVGSAECGGCAAWAF